MTHILYGVASNYHDVTEIALNKLSFENKFFIPKNDVVRAQIFGDPLKNVVKHIKIINLEQGIDLIVNDSQELLWNLTTHQEESLKGISIKELIKKIPPLLKLHILHQNIKLRHGSMSEEYDEQLMAAMFITENCKVLELGSNVGRNTLIIANLLADQTNLVTLETDLNTCRLLTENKEINCCSFHIEPSALSYRALIQNRWDTVPSEVVCPGYFKVNCITFQELEAKYQITFDTLVADCEGALYYILTDYPDMLNDLKLLIMENDYQNAEHKVFVDNVFKAKGFERVYVKAGGWGPCTNCFYEVWQKA